MYSGAREEPEQLGLLRFLDLEVPAHGQIHQRRGDVPHVHRLVQQGPGLGGGEAERRFVLGRHRALLGIPADAAPEEEHAEEDRDRES